MMAAVQNASENYKLALHKFNQVMAEWSAINPQPRREDYLFPQDFRAARVARFKGQMEARKLALQASGLEAAEKALA